MPPPILLDQRTISFGKEEIPAKSFVSSQSSYSLLRLFSEFEHQTCHLDKNVFRSNHWRYGWLRQGKDWNKILHCAWAERIQFCNISSRNSSFLRRGFQWHHVTGKKHQIAALLQTATIDSKKWKPIFKYLNFVFICWKLIIVTVSEKCQYFWSVRGIKFIAELWSSSRLKSGSASLKLKLKPK